MQHAPLPLHSPSLQVSCGENHTSALSLDGRLFTWGRGKYGQLGHGDFKSLYAPEPVKALFGSHLVQVWGDKVGLQPSSTCCPSSPIPNTASTIPNVFVRRRLQLYHPGFARSRATDILPRLSSTAPSTCYYFQFYIAVSFRYYP